MIRRRPTEGVQTGVMASESSRSTRFWTIGVVAVVAGVVAIAVIAVLVDSDERPPPSALHPAKR